MTITQALNNTAGRFTTLVVRNGNQTDRYCAQIAGATDNTVRFYDVNAGANRVVKTKQVVFARSGKTKFGSVNS
jgi:hypothetical protein